MTAKNIYECTVQELLDMGVDIDIYFHNVTSKENALSKIKQFTDTDPFFDIAPNRSCRWAKHRREA